MLAYPSNRSPVRICSKDYQSVPSRFEHSVAGTPAPKPAFVFRWVVLPELLEPGHIILRRVVRFVKGEVDHQLPVVAARLPATNRADCGCC